jgi:hypothetical protein
MSVRSIDPSALAMLPLPGRHLPAKKYPAAPAATPSAMLDAKTKYSDIGLPRTPI